MQTHTGDPLVNAGVSATVRMLSDKTPERKWNKILCFFILLGLAGLAFSVAVVAQTSSGDTASSTEQRLERLEQHQQELERELQKKDEEIQALKKQVTVQQGAAPTPAITPPPPASAPGGVAPPSQGAVATVPAGDAAASGPAQAPAGTAATPVKWGSYTDSVGFKVANTDKGDMNVAIYTYLRYLNQLGSDATYTYKSTGQTVNIDRRQEVQLLKVQIKFLGWLFDPKLRYFLYAWSSNASQGQGAQVVLAGNLNYNFNDYFTLGGGITSLPGVRSTEGNFPFWLNVDNRLLTDEFMRPSYTSGVWAKGNITPALRYQVMMGNNLSTLGVSSAQLNPSLNTVATALVWMPTTHEFGPGFGDFENHQDLATRFGVHYTHSTEDKQSQPNSDSFENTQIRLADGSVIFTPNLFGPGVTVTNLRYQMADVDAGIKYHGLSLEGEYYWRKLDNFRGPGTTVVSNQYNQGFQLQASMMAIDRTLQFYAAGSKVASGTYGSPWDTRLGANWFPFKNRVLRWNAQAMYLYKSPVGYTSLTYNVGSTGWIFNTDFEMAL
jgi:hypothetical protein